MLDDVFPSVKFLCCPLQKMFTPLHSAASSGSVEVVKVLLQRGANKAAKNKVRTTRTAQLSRSMVGSAGDYSITLALLA